MGCKFDREAPGSVYEFRQLDSVTVDSLVSGNSDFNGIRREASEFFETHLGGLKPLDLGAALDEINRRGRDLFRNPDANDTVGNLIQIYTDREE